MRVYGLSHKVPDAPHQKSGCNQVKSKSKKLTPRIIAQGYAVLPCALSPVLVQLLWILEHPLFI